MSVPNEVRHVAVWKNLIGPLFQFSELITRLSQGALRVTMIERPGLIALLSITLTNLVTTTGVKTDICSTEMQRKPGLRVAFWKPCDNLQA